MQIFFVASTASLPQIEAGKLRPIAVAGTTRAPKLPQVPTAVEAGFPYLVAPYWLAVTAPAATPRPIIDKLNAAFREALAVPETRARLATFDAEVKIGTPDELGKMLADERMTRYIEALVARDPRNPAMGRELPHLMRKANLKIQAVEPTTLVPTIAIARRLYAAALSKGVEEGLFTAPDVETWWREQNAMERDGTFYHAHHGYIVTASKF